MNRDRLVAALREQAEWAMLNDRSVPITLAKNLGSAADLIENQQNHIAALMKANDSLKDAIARRDKQIEDLTQGMAQLTKAVAVKEQRDEP